MQIAPVPPAVAPAVSPQQTVTQALPQVQAQAAAPIVERAVIPPTKGERGQKSRSNEDKAKGGDDDKASAENRGGNVNIKV